MLTEGVVSCALPSGVLGRRNAIHRSEVAGHPSHHTRTPFHELLTRNCPRSVSHWKSYRRYKVGLAGAGVAGLVIHPYQPSWLPRCGLCSPGAREELAVACNSHRDGMPHRINGGSTVYKPQMQRIHGFVLSTRRLSRSPKPPPRSRSRPVKSSSLGDLSPTT